ncbi:MAG TPA: protease modulator HflK [Phycisphaerae bacterium]|nr:protease modulator HflK [Phycisphaerae bacterium]
MTQLEQSSVRTNGRPGVGEIRRLPAADSGNNSATWFTAQLALLIFLVGVFLVWIFSGSYLVGNGEIAVVERLGQYLTLPGGQPLQVPPGWHYHLPWPIDTVYVIPTSRTQLLEISDFNQSPTSYEDWEKEILRENPQITTDDLDAIFNPYLITGDRNVLHSTISVQYQIADPVAYLQSVAAAPGQTTEQAVQGVLQILADHQLIMKFAASTVDEALESVNQAQNVQAYNVEESNNSIQGLITQLGLGLQVQKTQVEYVHWPNEVDQAFSDVLNAQQNETTAIQNAETQATQIIYQAKGDAQTIETTAKADANEAVTEATGEAKAFSVVYAQYQKDPKVVTLTLLNDTLSNVLNGAARVFVVQPNQRILITLPPPQEQVIVPSGP